MIKIKIRRSHKHALIDDCFFNLSKFKWEIRAKRYAARRFSEDGKVIMVLLHHCVVGRPLNKNLKVDHINGDTFDNRLKNLRIISHRENIINNHLRRDGKTSSKFPGVYWNKYSKRWKTAIRFNGKRKYSKGFKNESEAAEFRANFLREALAK